MTRTLRSLAVLLALSAIALFSADCAAPSLPLPPPTALVEQPPDAMGFVTVEGDARAGAYVGCLNNSTDNGVIVRSDVTTGAYTLRIEAQSDDVLTLWQFEASSPGGQTIDVVVPRP
jgi:hypothetical protein